MVAWGVVMTLMGLVQNYHGLLIARIFLGLAEAGLYPGVAYYLTMWYVLHNFPKRGTPNPNNGVNSGTKPTKWLSAKVSSSARPLSPVHSPGYWRLQLTIWMGLVGLLVGAGCEI